MRCCCNDNGASGIVYCERHAIETKRRIKETLQPMVMAGEALREELRKAGGDVTKAATPKIAELERAWLVALRRAKDTVDG